MAYELVLESRAAPAQVLESLRANAAGMTHGELSPAERRTGARGLRVTIQPDRFLIAYTSLAQDPAPVEVRGRLERVSSGGTRIEARCGRHWQFLFAPATLLALSIWFAAGDRDGAGVLWTIALALSAWWWFSNAAVTRGENDKARLLLARVRESLDRAETIR